ncbi:MAG TPA: isocitrate/isopropylmalate family dehydrogenase, partial [Anaerolineae bacterium]
GTILSVAFLLRYSLGLTKEADTVERAVDQVLSNGCRTADITQKGERAISTHAMGDAILAGIG